MGPRPAEEYLDTQVAAGRLKISDTHMAASHFLDLCVSGCLRRLLFAVGEAPAQAEIERNVDNAVRVFFAAYGPDATL